MKTVLLGYMGSGKTSIGKILSLRLDCPFKDLDTEIEIEEGKSISRIFSEKGELYFRKKENELLKKTLGQKGDLVLATGGGTPCYADSLEFLLNDENITTVYLKSEIPDLAALLFPEKSNRPLIAHLQTEEELLDFVRKHLFERGHYYSQAKITVKTTGKSFETITEEILEKLL